MSPQPGILPIVAPSESPPQSLVVTTDDATKTTHTAQMTTAGTTMSLKTESIESTKTASRTTATTEGTVVGVNPSSSSSSSCSSNENNCRTSVVSDSGSTSSSNSQKSEIQNEEEDKTACTSEDKESAQMEDDDLATLERPRRILLKIINPHIICNLCMGYLIDATTIVECLHSFCHSCIMKHLRTEQYCPRCEMMINTAKPNIKPDTTLQAIVYKLVPGLYEKELMRKRAFYRDRPDEAKLATPEQRGEDTEHLIFGPTENMSLSLEYADIEQFSEDDNSRLQTPKYLQCPAIFTVAHLKKFIIQKFGIDSQRFTVDIMYKVKTIVLMDHYTLMDVAYIYTWKRDAPMRFFFRVKESEKSERRRRAQSLGHNLRKMEAKQESKVENSIERTQPDTAIEVTKNADNVKVEKIEVKKLEIEEKELNQKHTESDEDKAKGIENEIGVISEVKNSKPAANRALAGLQSFGAKKEPLSPASEPPLLSPHLNSQQAQVEELSNENVLEIKVDPVEKSPKIKEYLANDKELAPEPKTEKLKITLVGKNKHGRCSSASESPKSDSSNTSSKSSKSNKTPKHHHHSSQQKSPPEHDERKVENIKLKIDLSKQNSVTIINMSGPESSRKEIVKSVKPEKEWKMKTKKEKDDRNNSPKSSPSGENKHQRFEIKNSPPTENSPGLVPPITIKAERINPIAKKTTPPPPAKTKLEELEKDDEEKKSQFLNSFALTPIKPFNSPEKSEKSKPISPSNTGCTATLPDSTASSALPSPPASVQPQKATQAVKRKNKEAAKPSAKKAKLETPKSPTVPDVKTKMLNAEALPSISFKLAPFPIGAPSTDLEKKQEDEKLMPAPPPLKVIDVFKKNGVKQSRTPKAKSTTAGKMKPANTHAHNTRAVPPGSLTPHPMIPPGIASSKIPITASTPGNRTPIARRYPPILPKSPRPNPFANIPTDVNKLLQNSGTEIKQITGANARDVKVYGPTVAPSSSQKPPMVSSPVQQPNSSPASRSNCKTPNVNNYLNYALFNASKARLSDVPLGCRTPIYTPNSPIYSPNSPQYMPNYNIPTQPTYKYTKSGSTANNYLQNVLGQNKQLSNLFPAPPVKKPPESPTPPSTGNNNSKTPPPDSENKKASGDENTLKRPYPFTRSPPTSGEKTPEPPEKQMKVQSLLNSCNINIPSSLSITITNEDSDSNINNSSNPKHKNPVNNYIEILKLPDNHSVSPEKSDQKKPTASLNQQQKKVDELKVSVSSSAPVSSAPAVFGPSNTKAVSVPKTSPQSITVKSFAAATSPTKQLPLLNPIDKKQNKIENGPSSTANSGSQKNKKTPSPDKRLVEKSQKKGSNPLSAEKKVSQENSAQSKALKNSSDPQSAQPSKKFRHILPRTASVPSQQTTNKATTSSPATAPTGKGGSKAQQKQSSTNSSTVNKKTNNNNNNNNNKKIEEILDLTSSKPSNTLSSSKSPPSTAVPPTVSSDLTTFLSESLLRAQQQAAANNSNGIFIPHLAAAANFNPHFASVNFGYNIQQAYLMEHISRMQKAGHEALEKYMQKLKAGGNSPKSPNNSSAKSPGGDVKESG